MPTSRVTSVVSQVRTFSSTEQEQFLDEISDILMRLCRAFPVSSSQDVGEVRFAGGINCPQCNCNQVIRWGKFGVTNGETRVTEVKIEKKQRYKCKSCGRCFCPTTETPLAYSIYQNRVVKIIECMLEGLSCEKTAKRLRMKAATIFRWRHRILAVMGGVGNPNLGGIIEMDDTYFPYSEKGQRGLSRPPKKRGEPAKKRGLSSEQVSVLTAKDRQGATLVSVVGRGQPNVTSVERILENRIGHESVICTDGSKTYKRFCETAGFKHVSLESGRRVSVNDPIYHIQNINAYHSRLKIWMERFCGVSTKYLPNYMVWFRFIDQARKLTSSSACRTMHVETCPLLGTRTWQAVMLTYPKVFRGKMLYLFP